MNVSREGPPTSLSSCPRALIPSQQRSSSGWYGTVWVCAHCTLSCHCTPLRRAWPNPFDSYPLQALFPPQPSPPGEQPMGSPPFLVASDPDHLCGPPPGSLQQFPICLELSSAKLDTVLRMFPPQGRAEGRITSLPCWPCHVQCTPGHHWPSCHEGTPLAHVSLLAMRTPKSFSAELLSSSSAPTLY